MAACGGSRSQANYMLSKGDGVFGRAQTHWQGSPCHPEGEALCVNQIPGTGPASWCPGGWATWTELGS
jgi:hypothetical protein